MSLSDAEKRTLELSSEVWNSLFALDLSEQDWREFQILFHAIQDKVLARPARRQQDEERSQQLRTVLNQKRAATGTEKRYPSCAHPCDKGAYNAGVNAAKALAAAQLEAIDELFVYRGQQ